jgi:histidinol-phosphatase (PHP family)
MIDSHVHIERGPYTKEWINEFVNQAVKHNIDELFLLEHSHRFFEFKELYSDICSYNEYQNDWFNRKNNVSYSNYLKLIDECKRESYPIKIYWGLEICYFDGKEDIIKSLTNKNQIDFLTGSIHWIDNWGFDHKPEFWNDKIINDQYIKYYDLMIKLVKSNIFDHLAHPDSIKCFNNYPDIDLTDKYIELTKSIVKNNIKVEVSGGLYLNYNHSEIGINNKLLNILKKNKAILIPASDAHSPENVGINIKECVDLINCGHSS